VIIFIFIYLGYTTLLEIMPVGFLGAKLSPPKTGFRVISDPYPDTHVCLVDYFCIIAVLEGSLIDTSVM
jgi:hypothetical protein